MKMIVVRAKAAVIKCENAHVNEKELCIQGKAQTN